MKFLDVQPTFPIKDIRSGDLECGMTLKATHFLVTWFYQIL
jgi:hypothetical protein